MGGVCVFSLQFLFDAISIHLYVRTSFSGSRRSARVRALHSLFEFSPRLPGHAVGFGNYELFSAGPIQLVVFRSAAFWSCVVR